MFSSGLRVSEARIRANIKIGPDGSAQVFLPPLEGCYSRALAPWETLQKAPSKVRTHLAWLQKHGEDRRGVWWNAPIEQHELIRGNWPVRHGDSVALFACDKGPLTDDKIERNLRWMSYS